MGYNVTKLSILQMEKHLASIHNLLVLKNEERKIEWSFDTSYLASRFLYRLRQAIHSADKLGIPPYDDLAGKFSLRQQGKKVEVEKKVTAEFDKAEPTIVENELELKGTDSFSLISAIMNIEIDKQENGIRLVDIKEVSPVLKGWLIAGNYDYQTTKRGILITTHKEKEEKENASPVEETNLDRHGVA